MLTLSYRRDGTSRFSDANRWGNFPAASLAWKVNEDFLKDNKTISELKLRAGWGITGQQDIGAGLFYFLAGLVRCGMLKLFYTNFGCHIFELLHLKRNLCI